MPKQVLGWLTPHLCLVYALATQLDPENGRNFVSRGVSNGPRFESQVEHVQAITRVSRWEDMPPGREGVILWHTAV